MGPSLRKSMAGDDHSPEVFSMVWLDASVNATSENRNVQQQLRGLVTHLKAFERTDDCYQYIRHSSKESQIILIVSGRLGREIVPRIHRLAHVACIYVYCMDKEKNEKWAQKFSKIKGVLVSLDELVGQIRSDRTRQSFCESDEQLPLNIYKRKLPADQSATTVNKQFIHFELLIDCLLRIKSNPTDKSRVISLCREIYQANGVDLSIIDEFERSYTSDTALWWYTKDSFVSRTLNKALRAQTIDVLYSFRFFLQDLREQLRLHQCPSSIRVYSGQFLSNDGLEMLRKSVGDYISISTFLATTPNHQQALKQLTDSEKFDGVLFEIDADPTLPGIKPFGSTNQDGEILFMAGSIFRIADIVYQADQSTIIRLTLYPDNDPQLTTVLKSWRPEVDRGEMNCLAFGEVLCKMGKLADAEKYYQRLLAEPSTDDYTQIAECYFALGNLAMERNDDSASSEWHQKSLAMKKQILEENDPSIADSYSSLADIERKKGNSRQALEIYKRALDICTLAYGHDHSKVGMCLHNIACIYGEEKDFQNTLDYQQKALEIMQKHFPADHLWLGQAHNNIGSVYRCLGKYELALEHYQLSLKIKSKSVSSRHPSLASAYNNIASVYEEMSAFKQALEHYEKAAAIYRYRFPLTSPDNVRIAEDIRRVSKKLK